MASHIVAVVGTLVMLTCVTFSSAKVYTVGDAAGWALSVDYTTWASDKTFNVGDSLVFNYDSSHTVDLVSPTDYATCTIGNSIASYNTGTTTIVLKTPGTHNFICGIMGHCSGGMKLTIDVSSGGVSPSAAPSSISADSPTTMPFGNALPNPTTTGTGNVPVDSSSPAMISPFVVVAFCLVALMSNYRL